MRHIIKPDHTVETFDDHGVGPSIHRCDDREHAQRYARLMSMGTGGEIIDETDPWAACDEAQRKLSEANMRLRDTFAEMRREIDRLVENLPIVLTVDVRQAEAAQSRHETFGDLLPRQAS